MSNLFEEKYVVDELVHRGHQFSISHGHCKNLGKKITINTVFNKPEDTLQEVNILKHVSHVPGVVMLLEHLKTGPNEHALILERFSSVTLRKMLFQSGPLSELVAAIIMKQTVDTVQHLAALNVVHKKLTPPNILVDLRTFRIKLTNFHTAGFFTSSILKGKVTNLTAPPEYYNDIPYNAEQHTVWNLGLLTFEMMHNKKAFSSLHDIQFAPVHINAPLSFDATIFVLGCLAKDPRQRPALSHLNNHPWFYV